VNAPKLQERETTVRAELRALVSLAWPIAIAQLGMIAMSLVDTAVLGRVSTDELAGASIGRSIGFASITLGMGAAMGLEPLASQAVGAGEPARAWEGLRANLKTGLLLSLPCVAAAFATTLALEPLGVEPHIVSLVRRYLVGQTPAMVLTLVFIATRVFLQAHGRTAPALVGSLVANVVNFFVVNLLVRGDDVLVEMHVPAIGLPRLGALGAGLALSIATLLLVVFVGVAALEHRARGAEPVSTRAVLKLGMPVGTQLLAEYSVFTVAAMLAGKLGAKVVSAHQVAIALASFTYMGALGVAGATAVRVGLAVGAGRSTRRAGFIGITVGAVFMCVSAVVFGLFPRELVDVFTDDPDVIDLGASLVRIAAVFQLFDGVQVVAAGALRGAGDVRTPFVAVTVAHWLVGFPIAVILCFALDLGARGLWWGLTGGLVAASIALAWRFVVLSRRAIARV
jgi:MATE family multidrug resistance protein